MNRELQKIIKRNQYRSKFYQYYKPPKERDKGSRRTPDMRETNDEPSSERKIHLPFLYQCLLAIIFLLAGMIVKKDPKLEPVNDFVFTSINLKRIEVSLTNTLGIIFPVVVPKDDVEVNLPVITFETTRNYKNGVIVRTELYEGIESHVEGTVIEIYRDDDLGEVIVIQDVEGNEWEFGMITDRRVNIYDRIYRGRVLGMAKTTDDYEGGEFYLAVKNRKRYLNVIDLVNSND